MTQKIVLKLKNRLLIPLYFWLDSISLIGKESRERTRFNKLLAERIEEINGIKTTMIQPYVKTDNKGKAKLIEKKEKDASGNDFVRMVYDFKGNTQKEKFEKEWSEYLDEELIIDVLEGNKSKIYTIKEIVLNTDQKFQGEMASVYDEWCIAFEALPPRQEAKR